MPDPTQPKIAGNFVFRAPLEPHLYDGCDYELYWRIVPAFLVALISLFVILRAHLLYFALGAPPMFGLFLLVRWYLREMAKEDPLHRIVHKRHTYYEAGYAATRRVPVLRKHRAIPPVSRLGL